MSVFPCRISLLSSNPDPAEFASTKANPENSIKLTHFPALALALFACTVSLSAATPPGKTQQLTSADQVPEGLAKSDWQSIRAAYEAGRHAFQPTKGGWQARNPGQQWTTKFDGRGFVAEPKDGGWQWGWS